MKEIKDVSDICQNIVLLKVLLQTFNLARYTTFFKLFIIVNHFNKEFGFGSTESYRKYESENFDMNSL